MTISDRRDKVRRATSSSANVSTRNESRSERERVLRDAVPRLSQSTIDILTAPIERAHVQLQPPPQRSSDAVSGCSTSNAGESSNYWTPRENISFKTAILAEGSVDWDAVASILGSTKSADECRVRCDDLLNFMFPPQVVGFNGTSLSIYIYIYTLLNSRLSSSRCLLLCLSLLYLCLSLQSALQQMILTRKVFPPKPSVIIPIFRLPQHQADHQH